MVALVLLLETGEALVSGEIVDLIEDVDGWFGEGVYLSQDGVHCFDLIFHFWVVDVNNMKQEVGFNGLFQGGTEGLDKLWWEILNETDSIGDERLVRGALAKGRFQWRMLTNPFGAHVLWFEDKLADACVQGGEQFVGGQGFLAGEGIEEAGFAGVGVADDANRLEVAALAVSAVQFANFLALFQVFHDGPLHFFQVAAHEFDVGFTATARTDPTGLSRELDTHTKDTRPHVPYAGQFDLQFCLFSGGVFLKDFEDQVDAVPHLQIVFADALMKVVDLTGFELIVHNNDIGLELLVFFNNLVNFSGANIGTVVGGEFFLDLFYEYDAAVRIDEIFCFDDPVLCFFVAESRRDAIYENGFEQLLWVKKTGSTFHL